ncbi:MAG: thioredoxin domain-containing protein [Saprospiraceae bacterium]|nr:thioredoxin domain-containing protein [Saprospiraceae bacterium]
MNRLQHETSPYLLQHAHNPVDWYAWKPEALERARAEQKPILVSIGYSTCHWCHVMERESFENEDIAAFMNEHFINIKVDREERPDVDAIYMDACQLLTGGGGWPLNCFLTPAGKPFYAGTYFPPRPAHGRPSWLQLLQHISNIWESKREVAIEQAEKLLQHIQRNDHVFLSTDALKIAEAESTASVDPEKVFYQMREHFDRVEGGFGGAPKFPSSMAIQYLLNYAYLNGNAEALEHALFSLEKMTGGGMYDQIGGGFARYATDRAWLVPHFEKMLYDNALLVSVLSEAYKIDTVDGRRQTVDGERQTVDGKRLTVDGGTVFREAIEDTLAYVAREMTHPDGGFYSAQDADSEGVEGKFYVWDKSEIVEVLGEKEAALLCAYYGVTDEGNWEEKNILWRPAPYDEFAAANGMDIASLTERLRLSRERLYERRSERVWPGLDDKILLGWNALMSSAYAAAFTALGHAEYRDAAVKNIDFLLDRFSKLSDEAALYHSWKNGVAQYDAFLDDYAFLIAALTELYQITFNVRYLQYAEKYTEHVLSYFYDPETGLFFYTHSGQTDIVLRKKDLYDNAMPSGNSTMTLNLQRLGILLDRRNWRERAAAMLLAMRSAVERFPLSFERWAATALNEAHPMHEIAVVGDNAIEKALSLQRYFLPNKVVAAHPAGTDSIALLAGKTGAADAMIYVCRDFMCQRPVQTEAEFRELVQPE